MQYSAVPKWPKSNLAVDRMVIFKLGRGPSGPALLIAVFGETGPAVGGAYRRVSDLEAGLIG